MTDSPPTPLGDGLDAGALASTLPRVLRTEQAAELLDISPDTLWRLAREGTAPVEPLRLGRALRWPTRRILELLGEVDESAA